MSERTQKEKNEFLSQFISNPRKEGEIGAQLLYKKSVTHEQFQPLSLEQAKTLRQTPYANLAGEISKNQPNSVLNSKTETQNQFTHKRFVPHNQFIITDKQIWHDDRRTKAEFPGKKETETQNSYKRQEPVKSKFDYPNLYEHHFSIGSGMRKIQEKTHYKREFNGPNHEGAVSKSCLELYPQNQQLIPKTMTGRTRNQEEFERFC